MKGIETMPVRILLTLIIVAVVIGVSVWQINYFTIFNEKAKFKEDLTNLYQTIKTTQSFGDQGSFTTVWVKVPASSNFTISVDNDDMQAYANDEKFSYKFTADIMMLRNQTTNIKSDADNGGTGPFLFPPGEYTLRLFYGTVADEQTKTWTIYFK